MTELPKKQRLSKKLAACGVASRRAAEELIFAGKVRVNGEKVLVPQTMVSDEDQITVKGKAITEAEPKVYYMLNKPAGYLCSSIGNQTTKIAIDLIDCPYRLFTVGRLDKDTTGLILVTNDGHFANRVIHPSNRIYKEYLVKTDHEITAEHLKQLSKGMRIDGTFVQPVRVRKVRKGTLRIVIAEGKKREVRLLMEQVGLKVHELSRIRIGGLHLGTLPIGSYREMTQTDKDELFGGKDEA